MGFKANLRDFVVRVEKECCARRADYLVGGLVQGQLGYKWPLSLAKDGVMEQQQVISFLAPRSL